MKQNLGVAHQEGVAKGTIIILNDEDKILYAGPIKKAPRLWEDAPDKEFVLLMHEEDYNDLLAYAEAPELHN